MGFAKSGNTCKLKSIDLKINNESIDHFFVTKNETKGLYLRFYKFLEMYYENAASSITYDMFVTSSFFVVFNCTASLSSSNFISSPMLTGNYKLQIGK